MDVGVAMAPPLINALKKRVHQQGLVILDAPPGTNCPVIAALGDVDYVVLVTEPTPFGLNDLKLAVALVRTLNLPFGVVINRADSGNDDGGRYCRSEQIDVLMELPDDRRIAQVYSRGEVIVKSLPEYKDAFKGLLKKIVESCAAAKEELI